MRHKRLHQDVFQSHTDCRDNVHNIKQESKPYDKNIFKSEYVKEVSIMFILIIQVAYQTLKWKNADLTSLDQSFLSGRDTAFI